MPPGPLLKGRETRCPDLIPVTRFMLFEQAVVDQKRDTTLTDLDRRDHDHAPGAALPEASCTGGGCRFMGHVSLCYYGINGQIHPTFGYDFNPSSFSKKNTGLPQLR